MKDGGDEAKVREWWERNPQFGKHHGPPGNGCECIGCSAYAAGKADGARENEATIEAWLKRRPVLTGVPIARRGSEG